MFTLSDIPNELFEKHNAPLLNSILRGIEREALRVKLDGSFSMDPHPHSLGSALTHPQITTDFSEALLEFITPPTHSVAELFQYLENVHRYAISQMPDELLWTSSMPCKLPSQEEDIPVAEYGVSHNGKMKTTYRKGLGHRYGRSMQTVAGVHYNFSLPNAFWAHFHAKDNSLLSLEDYKDQRYFALIRNFRRHYWLLILLFGASPAMCGSFVGERAHKLERFPGNKALYLPYATSLRMGDLGYQSSAQESLFICYNEKKTYIKTLAEAIIQPFEGYTDLPLKNNDGSYEQLSKGLLQIENEFYSAIRPKRTAKPGETALTALHKRGVEYIEVRCLDINPFTPLGVSEEQVAFLDSFLLYCALSDSPDSDLSEFDAILKNQKAIVNEGRKPGLMLKHRTMGEMSATDWANKLLEAMQPAADMLDAANQTDAYVRALETQKTNINALQHTPSARILDKLKHTPEHYPSFSLSQAKINMDGLRSPKLDSEVVQRFEQMTRESHSEQAKIEAACDGDFDAFLKRYFKQYNKLL